MTLYLVHDDPSHIWEEPHRVKMLVWAMSAQSAREIFLRAYSHWHEPPEHLHVSVVKSDLRPQLTVAHEELRCE